MNRIYNELLSKLDSRSQKALRNAQREWIAFRDREFEFLDAWYGSMQGKIWRITDVQQKMEFIKRRALELQSYINSIR